MVSSTLRSSPCTDQWSLRPRPLHLTNSDQCVTSQGGQPPVIGQLRTPGGQSANSSPPSHTQSSVLVTALHTHNVHHCTHSSHTLIKRIKHCAKYLEIWCTNDQMLHIVHNTRQLSSPVMRCYQQRVSRVTSLQSGAQPGLPGVQRAAVLQTAGNIIMTPPRETLFTGPHQIESKSSSYHPCSLNQDMVINVG